MRLGLWLSACLALSAPLAAAPTQWVQGNLSARVLEAGYTQDAKSGAWEAEVELRFRDLSDLRRCNQAVQVQFLDDQGKVKGSWKTFLSLSPGQAQHRRVRAPSHLGCAGALSACPPLSLRLLTKKPMDPAFAIPAQALAEHDLPPAGVPLYVARVFDGDTFQLLDGQKVRLLGIDAPELKGKDGRPEPYALQASALLSQRVMDDPVTLVFDGEKRDNYGRVLALVFAADGACLNQELLQKGLAKVYPRSDFSRKEAFSAAEAKAQQGALGLWSASKP